jgi:hypothetical protein
VADAAAAASQSLLQPWPRPWCERWAGNGHGMHGCDLDQVYEGPRA